MMSSAGTSRASRSSKDKTVKIQQTTQNVKSEGPPKHQPTAEQIRLHQMIADKNDIEDPVVAARVNQVMELTGRGKDDVIVALHDCDQDPNRAINMLLEGEDHQQGEWQESTKRKKGKAQTPNAKGDGTPNHTDTREKSRDRDDFGSRDSGPPREREGGRRGRQPPRMARKNREREENERNAQRNQRSGGDGEDVDNRERSYERGRGRGRGRMNGVRHRDMDSHYEPAVAADSEAVYVNHTGQMNGSGGRGRGRGGRSYRSSRYDKAPQIDTWTNETAENAEKENNSWGDMGEEWGPDEWTGSLEDTKVFTASSIAEPSSKGFSSAVGDNDAKMFTPPAMTVDNQVFSSNLTIENSNQSALNDSTNTLPNSIGQNAISQNSIGQSSHTLGQRLDLGLLLQKPTEGQASSNNPGQSQFMSQFSKQATESLKNAMGVGSQSQSQSQYMSQFSKEATESIKSMMGIGTSSSSHVPPASVASPVVRPPVIMPQAPSQPQQPPVQSQPQQLPPQSQPQQAVPPASQAQQQSLTQQQRGNKPHRSKLPPPSKIPASAVEMPGQMGTFQLDVQFGNWDFAPSESSGFSFGSRTDVTSSYSAPISTTTTSSSQSNHLQQEHKTTEAVPSPISPAITPNNAVSSVASSTAKPHISSLDNMSQSSDRSPRSNVFQNSSSPATTPNKDYSQSRLDQSRKITPPDPIPYPSDRKASPHYSQRSSGGISSSSKGATSPSQTSFSQNNYSNYPGSSGYQSSSKSPSSGYNSHQSNSLSGNNLSSGMQSHMSSSSPGQYSSHSGYSSSSSFQSQNAFSSNQGQSSSLYQSSSSQPSAYSSQSPNTYQTSNSSSGYQSQSASSYPSQSSTSYHGRDSQSSSSSYQPSVSQSSSSSHYQTSGSQSSSSYQRDNQQSQSGYQSYGSSSHQNSLQSSPMTMSTTKLSDSLSKASLKDSTSLDNHPTQQNSYEHSSSTTTPTITAATTTTASLSGGNVSVTSALGLSSATTVTTSSSKTSNLPVSSKAPPNLPPGVPLIGHGNYMMQPGMTFAPFGLAQQPVYSFEDMQLLQQRLPLHGYPYDMQFQPPTTLTGRDQGTMANVPYTGADGKLGRVDAQSPVQAQTSQPGQNQSGHQQTYMNPTIPPGYNYYYPGGMLPNTPYSYTTPMFPVPAVTNAAHAGTTANAQFQKPGAYGSHAYNAAGGYDDLGSQGQDFSKYAGASQSQSKASAGASVTSNATDLSGSTYGKAHTQSFDKASFHAATPPPFNMPLSTGTQGGPMAPTAAYGTPYVPMMPHQAHSQMIHPHMQQDSTGGSSRGSQPNSSQPKPGGNKPYSGGYWSTN